MSHNRIAFTVTLGELAEIPGSPFAYWAPKSLRELFKKFPPLDRDQARRLDQPKIADVKQGLATADDLRFTRYWWEVPVEQIGTSREETFQGKKWAPFAKGGKPFYHDIQLVVNWGRNGEEIKSYRDAKGRLLSRPQNESYYFRAGLASNLGKEMYAALRQGCLGVWSLPKGVIIGTARTGGIFPSGQITTWTLLTILNARFSFEIIRILRERGAGEAGELAQIPIHPSAEHVSRFAKNAHHLLREWSTGDEPSTAFVAPWILQLFWRWQGKGDSDLMPQTGHPLAQDFEWRCGVPQEVMDWLSREMAEGFSLRTLAEACVRWEAHLRREIERIQREIDDEVYRLYGISEEDRALIEAELATAPEETEEEGEGEPDEMEETSPEDLLSAEEHIRRLIHFLAHQAVKEDPDGIVPLSDCYPAGRAEMEPGLPRRVRKKLRNLFGEEAMPTVEREIREVLGTSLENWLSKEFFSYHLGLYRLRPVIWQVVLPQRSSGRRSSRTGPSTETFSVFLYWHRLDADTLRKVRSVYLQPYLDSASREIRDAQKRLVDLLTSEAPMRERGSAERELRLLKEKEEALQKLADAIDALLRPHSLEVQSKSEWVKEKVREIVSEGYRPNRAYGVRVNIEPLKQAGILHPDASRVKG